MVLKWGKKKKKKIGNRKWVSLLSASACRHCSEGQNLWPWMPLCNSHEKENKLSTATCRPVTILLCGSITGTNSTNTLHSSSIIHQWVSERIRDPRGWRDGEWLNAFPNSELLFSFCRWDAEGKGNKVTLAHMTRPEVTSNFLNTISKK